MSFRNRPVLDRKHRPRWQDELRTQQLIVAGFALAIAAALGIFGATIWFSYYESHLRPVASVGDVTYNVDDLTGRMDIISSELQASYADLTSQLGGVRDPIIQQAQQAIEQALEGLVSSASDSLVLGRVLTNSAGQYGITVTDAAVSAEVTRRRTLGERLKLSLITVRALPSDAKPGEQPTDADWTRAKAEIDDIAAQLGDGADFATLATEKSHDSSAAVGGALGWVENEDQSYDAYFQEAQPADVADLLGPTKDDDGYHLVRLEAREAERLDARLIELLGGAGVTDARYRTYIRDELLRTAFTDHFTTSVMTKYQPQQQVSQIFISNPQGLPVPQQRLRHFLAQPLPGEQDQATATDAQWAAALARAEAFRVEATKPGADWFSLAEESDDTGSGSQGGDLGWFDAASSNFVPEFEAAVAELGVGELSEPVKTQFGYHIIEIVAERVAPGGQAATLLATLREDPDQFATLAREQSDDRSTAREGGDLGWVIRYEFETLRSDAIFALTTPDQISEVLDTGDGFYIFKLIDTSPLRWVPPKLLDQVRRTGVSRWLNEIRDAGHTWVDPQFGPAPATG
ncbi:MAG: peptidylprolyl isomerase [Chloroflexota bacterium]|nr:peptidylprolyl isomerase [Chloroflexota bacterium]